MQSAIATERLNNALILVVDDVAVNRKMLSHSLLQRGYSKVVMAENGAQALQITHTLKPDLVILDLMMPGMDGFSYCQAIRQDPAYDNMPIIVQTALDEMGQKLKAFQLGASDYICKPVDPGEIGARTQIHLMKKMLVEDLCDFRTRISSEMEAARSMQNRLMPNQQQVDMCERVFNLRIGRYFETSSLLGGDCWGMRPLSDNKLAIYMYDFSGHGVSAAMNIFRMHTITQEFIHASGEPGNFLTMLNRHLYPLIDRSEFATMFYGIIDTDANCLLYASAAVPPAMLFSKIEQKPVLLSNRGFPLGVVANASYETKYTPFMQGDMLLCYSDCLNETANGNGDFLSEQQIQNVVLEELKEESKPGDNPAARSVEALMHAFHQHSKTPINDDLTINSYWRCHK